MLPDRDASPAIPIRDFASLRPERGDNIGQLDGKSMSAAQ